MKIEGTPQEIAALVIALQKRSGEKAMTADEIAKYISETYASISCDTPAEETTDDKKKSYQIVWLINAIESSVIQESRIEKRIKRRSTDEEELRALLNKKIEHRCLFQSSLKKLFQTP